MTLSFEQLWEIMSPLMDSGNDSRAIKVIQAGKGLRTKDEIPFWQEFINLCSNAEGMAELFDVSPEKVRNWSARIKHYLQQLDKHTMENPSKVPQEVLPTGKTGAFTTNN